MTSPTSSSSGSPTPSTADSTESFHTPQGFLAGNSRTRWTRPTTPERMTVINEIMAAATTPTESGAMILQTPPPQRRHAPAAATPGGSPVFVRTPIPAVRRVTSLDELLRASSFGIYSTGTIDNEKSLVTAFEPASTSKKKAFMKTAYITDQTAAQYFNPTINPRNRAEHTDRFLSEFGINRTPEQYGFFEIKGWKERINELMSCSLKTPTKQLGPAPLTSIGSTGIVMNPNEMNNDTIAIDFYENEEGSTFLEIPTGFKKALTLRMSKNTSGKFVLNTDDSVLGVNRKVPTSKLINILHSTIPHLESITEEVANLKTQYKRQLSILKKRLSKNEQHLVEKYLSSSNATSKFPSADSGKVQEFLEIKDELFKKISQFSYLHDALAIPLLNDLKGKSGRNRTIDAEALSVTQDKLERLNREINRGILPNRPDFSANIVSTEADDKTIQESLRTTLYQYLEVKNNLEHGLGKILTRPEKLKALYPYVIALKDKMNKHNLSPFTDSVLQRGLKIGPTPTSFRENLQELGLQFDFEYTYIQDTFLGNSIRDLALAAVHAREHNTRNLTSQEEEMLQAEFGDITTLDGPSYVPVIKDFVKDLFTKDSYGLKVRSNPAPKYLRDKYYYPYIPETLKAKLQEIQDKVSEHIAKITAEEVRKRREEENPLNSSSTNPKKGQKEEINPILALLMDGQKNRDKALSNRSSSKSSFWSSLGSLFRKREPAPVTLTFSGMIADALRSLPVEN